MAALVGLLLALPAASEARTFYPDCTAKPLYKPRSLIVFCADAGMRIRRTRWSRWGAREARARSRFAYANNCVPSCAEGRFIRYRVRLVLHRARTCPDGGKRVFTRMTVIFVGRKASGPRKFTQRLQCRSLAAKPPPFPIVTLAGFGGASGTEVTELTVRGRPRWIVRLSCQGAGCPVRQLTRTIGSEARVRLRAAEEVYAAGDVLELRITDPDARSVGKVTRVTFREDAAPKRTDACLAPGTEEPTTCT